MKIARLSAIVTFALVAGPVLADDTVSSGGLAAPDVMQTAIDSGVCGERQVLSAVLNTATNQIEVTCEEDVAGFVPLIGGIGPALAAGAALLVVAGASSDTQ
ncbi:MAG: hypothetical protein IT542_10570 [Rubellimicrobium sp.]|nr:hypothetical protein [Rubellimicrobium sp.]